MMPKLAKAKVKEKHVHSYTRYKKKFYRCTAPDCMHSAERTYLFGKQDKCPFCGTVFILTWKDLLRATPRCKNCSHTKEAIQFQKAQSIMNTLFDDLRDDASSTDKTQIDSTEDGD